MNKILKIIIGALFYAIASIIVGGNFIILWALLAGFYVGRSSKKLFWGAINGLVSGLIGGIIAFLITEFGLGSVIYVLWFLGGEYVSYRALFVWIAIGIVAGLVGGTIGAKFRKK